MQNSKEIIKIKGLSKTFGAGSTRKEVLKNIDLTIDAGQLIGYIGPNGAGKSTTVKILCGIISDFGGNISIFGESFSGNELTIKRRIGYIPENGNIYDTLTPLEYGRFLADIYGMNQEKTLFQNRATI